MAEGTYRDWIVTTLDDIKKRVLEGDADSGFITGLQIQAANSGGVVNGPGSFELHVGIVRVKAKGKEAWLVSEPDKSMYLADEIAGAPAVIDGECVELPDAVVDHINTPSASGNDNDDVPYDIGDREFTPAEINTAVAALNGEGVFTIPGKYRNSEDGSKAAQRFVALVQETLAAGKETVTIN